jgi:outer membrane protein OmpA-like peptidoglycan-associated protein
VQSRARLIEAEQALVRNRERQARAEGAVKDAEIALLTVQTALRDAERRALESEVRAEEAQRRLAEQLSRLEGELKRREDAQRTATKQTAAEREKAAAEVAMLRGDLTKARAAAAAAAQAAEAERERLTQQRRANEARAAELARLQLQQEDTQRKLSATLAELADVREEARGLIVSLPGSIYFDFDRAEVRAEMQGRLVEIAKALSAVDRGSLLIEGHTDSDGTSDYNLRLSELRAEAVRKILVDAGVGSDRVRALGFGEMRPRVPNTTASAKAQNRRVEIVIEEMGRPTSR